MSKALSAVGGAVSGVVRNVGNVVKGATKILSGGFAGKVLGIVKDFAQSKLGKTLITAAVIYFGGAALSGAFGGGAAAGTTGWAGATAGVEGAASSLSGAWTSALKGEFTQAGGQVATGFGGGAAPSAEALAGNADKAAMLSNSGYGSTTVAGGTPPPITPPATPPVTPPAASMSVGEGLMGAAKIQAGTALIGGAMQGKAAQDQRDAELEQARLARERYNANAGAQLWSSSQPATGGVPTATTPQYGAFSYDPMAQAKSLNQQRWDEYQARQGLVSRNMA